MLQNSDQFQFVGLVAWTKFSPAPRLDFVAKMACSHEGTRPRDFLQELVARTSPLVCADLYVIIIWLYDNIIYI